jgi:hypothetical protein
MNQPKKHMTDEIDVDPELDGAGGNPADGGKGDAPETTPIKIGEQEYTADQLTEYIKKATDYDALLPEFTKKSQALKSLLGDKDLKESQEDLPSFLKEGWKPKDFKELGSALKEAVEWGEKRSQKATEEKSRQSLESKKAIDAFVEEVRKSDKEFDDKEFFQYIERHKIKVDTVDDLKSAYSVYSEANADGKLAERMALSNKLKRGADSVSKPSSAGGKLPYDANELRVRSTGIVDAAKEALSKLK